MSDTKKTKNGQAETTSALVVACPECKKKFKPKTDVRGKKIKCPFCTHPFVVPMGKEAKSNPEVIEADEPVAEAVPAPEEKKPDFDAEFDADPNPYGVKNIDLTPRCPNCTEEMGPHDIICLACGYNTLTREWGKTSKTVGVSFGQHFKYLLPALSTAAFMFFAIVFLLYYCIVTPIQIAAFGDNWVGWVLGLTDHESLRMWTTVAFLLFIWMGGMFCFKKFIEKPKPDELSLE